MEKTETQPRQTLLDNALKMQASGLSPGRSGNFSIRHQDTVLITPSALAYDQMTINDIVSLSLNGRVLDTKQNRKPSSEWPFHTAIYNHYPEASAIVHCHSTYATTLACLNKSIPAFHYMVAMAGGDSIRCSGYATFGSEELATLTVNALKNRKACLLANHGQIAYGNSPESALELALEVENLATIYCQTLQIGMPDVLTKEQMDEVIGKFSSYRP